VIVIAVEVVVVVAVIIAMINVLMIIAMVRKSMTHRSQARTILRISQISQKKTVHTV
jgi:hypothetical protein